MDVAFWRERRVLVTGANGFVGAWLVRGLVEAGAQVVGLIHDHLPHSTLKALGYYGRMVAVPGTVTDLPLLERVLNRYEVDTCFHLAAQALVGAANRSPLPTLEANVRGTWTALEACRRTPTIRCIVVASSDKAYGDHPQLPYTEELPLLGLNPYDASKACADILARSYARTFGLPLAVTRCANIYGGGDLNFSRIIPDTIRAALSGRRPIIRSDGTPRRDYLYIEDAVEAYLTLAEQVERPQVRGQAFNFGTGTPLRVSELVCLILSLAGVSHLEPQILGQASNEIQDQYLDSGRARAVLGWQARVPLSEGLRRTLDWYRQYFAAHPPPGAGA